MDGEESKVGVATTDRKPVFSWSMLGRKKVNEISPEIRLEEYEKFRSQALSLHLIKTGENTPEDWKNFRSNIQEITKNMDLLDQAMQKKENMPDAIQIFNKLSEFLLFVEGNNYSEKLIKIYHKNFDRIAAEMNHGNLEQDLSIMQTAARMVLWSDRRRESPFLRNFECAREMNLLQRYSNVTVKWFEDSLKENPSIDYRNYMEPMAVLLEFGNKPSSSTAYDALMRSLNNEYYNPKMRDPIFRFGFAAEIIKKGLIGNNMKRLSNISRDVVSDYGVDFNDIVNHKFGFNKLNSLKFGYVYCDKTGDELIKLGNLESQRRGITNFYLNALKDRKYYNPVTDDTLIESYDLVIKGEDLFAAKLKILTDLPDWDETKANRFIQKWTQDRTINVLQSMEYVEINLEAIIKLETEIPGITTVLNKEFHIYDFARYPKELMLEQYRQRDRRDIPYGIMIYPYADWNGSFYEKKKMLEKFFNQVEGNYAIRVMEVATVSELIRGLIGLHKRYSEDRDGKRGPGHKIAFGIVGGHGQKDGIQFGYSPIDGMLLSEYLLGKGAPKVKMFFDENPTIVLMSCFTGEKKGIGQLLSEVLNAHLISPNASTSLSDLDAKFDEENKIILDAEYDISKSKSQYRMGVIKH